MPVTGVHVIDPNPEHLAFDVCLNCGKAIQLREDTQQLVTMIGFNAECYGRPYSF